MHLHGTKFVYDEKSLNLFSYTSSFRLCVGWITEWVYFDYFVILLIIGSSVCMVVSDPNDT